MDPAQHEAQLMPEKNVPLQPSAGQRANRNGWIWFLIGLGLVAGLLATITGAASHTILVRRLAMLALVGTALGITAVISSRDLAKPVEAPERPLGGAGYNVPRVRRVRFLHIALTLLYNLGIMIVVLAALVRFKILPVDFAPGVLQAFPSPLGIYLAMLALAAKWQADLQGGATHTWYTRAHGWFLAILGSAVLLAGALVTLLGPIQTNGTVYLGDEDLEVLALVTILGVGTQLFLTAGLPTVFEIGAGLMRAFSRKEKANAADTPPIVYAGMLALGFTLVIGYLLYRFNALAKLGNFQDQRVALLLLLFPVALALFFLVSALQVVRESRRGLYRKRITSTLRTQILVYSVSGVLGLFFGTLLVLNLAGSLGPIGPIQADLDLSKDFIALMIATTAGPIGWHLARQNRRVDAIEARLPDFLNDLAETRRAGLTLTAALQSTSVSDYGDLSVEIKKMADQVSWGVAFTDALAQFAERVKTALVRRTAYLIIEASRTGGSVAEILKAAAKDAYEIKGLEAERRVSMMTYLIVIYVVFFVFLSVIAILDVQFIPQVLKANDSIAAAGGSTGAPIGGAHISKEALRFTYFMAAIVQSIGNGIVGGVLSEGRVSAGLRHVALMTLMAWILFRFALPA